MNIDEVRKLGYKVAEKDGETWVLVKDKNGTQDIVNLNGFNPSDHRPLTEMRIPKTSAPMNERIAGQYERLRRKGYLKDVQEAQLNSADKVRKDRINEVKEMSTPFATLIHTGSELNDLVEGTKQIADFSNYALSNALTLGQMPNNSAMERMLERKQKADADNELMQIFEDNTSVSKIGTMFPYIATGQLIEPLAKATFGRAIGTVGDAAQKAVKATGGVAGRAIQSAANKPVQSFNFPYVSSPVVNPASAFRKNLATELDDTIVTPLQNMASHRANRAPIVEPFREGRWNRLGTSMGTGSVEGAMDIDENPLEGATSSGFGSLTGLILEPKLSKAPNLNSKYANQILDEAYIDGYRPTPGVRTGQPVLATKEQGMRTNDKYSLYMKQFDDANDKYYTKKAREATGMDLSGESDFSPDELNDHMAKLRAIYQDLEARSMGKINRADIRDYQNYVDSIVSPKNRKAVQGHLDAIANLKHTQNRGSNGQFTGATFNGTDYQKTRMQLQDAMKTAQGNNKTEQYNALKGMIKMLDDGMEAGIRHHGDPNLVQKWKDANEMFAMTNILKDYGLHADGTMDTKGLVNYLMTKDADRLLTGKGGKVRKLHDIAKLQAIEVKQPGKGLDKETFDGVAILPDKSVNLIGTPASLMTPMHRKMMADAYMNRWVGTPSKGLFNMDKDNPMWNSEKVFRAFEQGQDQHVDAYNFANDTYDAGTNFTKEKWGNLMRAKDNAINKYKTKVDK